MGLVFHPENLTFSRYDIIRLVLVVLPEHFFQEGDIFIRPVSKLRSDCDLYTGTFILPFTLIYLDTKDQYCFYR